MKPDNSSNIFMLRGCSQLHERAENTQLKVPKKSFWTVRNSGSNTEKVILAAILPTMTMKKDPKLKMKVQIHFFLPQGVTWMAAELCFYRTGQRATINTVNTVALLLKLCK